MLASATLLTLSPLFIASTALAQAASTSPSWSVVTGSAVNVRSGPSAQSAYAFGKLRQGDVVRIVREEFGWARVAPEGAAFGEVFAYVPADRRVSLSADGNTATVTARTELRAPNMEAAGSPDKSWKQIGSVDQGATLTVLGSVKGERETVYKVRVPASAEAWVNMTFLRAATEAEAAAAVATANAAAAAAPAPATVPAAPASAAVETGLVETVPGTPAQVAAPVNAPASGAPAPAPTSPDIANTPAIPPLMGQPAPAAETVELGATRPAAPVAPKPKFVSKRAKLDDLEQQFQLVRAQPEASAEFAALKAKYDELVDATEQTSSVRSVASARSQQLALLVETQSTMQVLESRKAQADRNRVEIAKLVLDIQRRADFTAIGVLNASAVYDGSRLPELYRLCDPMTGATLAYVEPNPDIAMGPMLGTLVGVKGGTQYDPALRVTVITPLSMDLLTLRTTPQVTKSEETRPIEEAGTIAPMPTVVDGGPCPEDEALPPEAAPAPDAPEKP
jgi:SH3-like domain-containing protein